MTTHTSAPASDEKVERPFPDLTNAERERLAMLAEEAGEIVQAVGKVLRHGYDSRHPDGGPDNRASLERECRDFLGVLWGMQRAGDLAILLSADYGDRRQAWERKLRYAHHQPRTIREAR